MASRVKVFRTAEPDPVELNKFLAEDGKTISVVRLHASASEKAHYVMVEYKLLLGEV